MKLVIITGCLGLIGSHVTRMCLEKNWKVYGIDKCTYAANLSFLEEFKENDNFTFLKEDIVTLSWLPDCDYVINIAAESHVGNSILNSDPFIHSNIVGVKNLLDLIRKKPVHDVDQPVFFHFSTDEVYGDIIDGAHFESDNLNPSNPYSASKAAADMFILSAARTYGTKYVILRPTNNYGIGQYPEKLIPGSVKSLIRGKKIKLHDEGDPYRNWLHSNDTARAVIEIIESGQVNEIYNVAGIFEQKNRDTFRKIVECYYGPDEDWTKHCDLGYKRPGQDVRYALNDDKLRALGWKPQELFNTQLPKIVEHYKNNFKW